MRWSRHRLAGVMAAAALVVVATVPVTGAGASPAAVAGADWPAYLFNPSHSSTNLGATAIVPANASSLTSAWAFKPTTIPKPGLGGIYASPTVVGAVVYIGANNGTFYALNEKTGAVIWQRNIGYEYYANGCGSRGITATATVARDPVSHVLTVYVSSGSGYLYALNAHTGAVIWKSVIALPTRPNASYYDWSSPTVANNKIYIGVSGECVAHVRGALFAYNQSTGQRVASYYTVPAGTVGGSVWSSAAVAPGGDVFFGTGNDLPPTQPNAGTSESVVELNPTTLARVGAWHLPLSQQSSDDKDFGASVTLFSATLPGSRARTAMLGLCNKNGVFYAFRQGHLGAGPVWQHRVANNSNADNGMTPACLAAAIPTGSHLILAAMATKVNGTAVAGSVQEVDAATGRLQWATGLPAPVFGTPSLDGAGVLSVATYGKSPQPSADYLLDVTTGAILATVSTKDNPEFAQPVFSGNYLLLATTARLMTYQVPAASSTRRP